MRSLQLQAQIFQNDVHATPGQQCALNVADFSLDFLPSDRITASAGCRNGFLEGLPSPGYAASDGFAFNFEDVSNFNEHSDDSDDSDAHIFDFDNSSALVPLLVAPGTYHLCWCRPADASGETCQEPGDFDFPVGFLRILGPYELELECLIGSKCIVALAGTGLMVTDQLVATKICGTKLLTRTFGDMEPVTGTVNETATSFYFDFGFLDMQIVPETIQLCWCDAISRCEDASDFRALAAHMLVLCPPGKFFSNSESICAICPAGFYCPGGASAQRLSCQQGSTSSPGAHAEDQCICEEAYFRSKATGICTTCAHGLGFNESQNRCVECDRGYYSDGGLEACKECPAGRYSDKTLTASVSCTLYLSNTVIFLVCPCNLNRLRLKLHSSSM